MYTVSYRQKFYSNYFKNKDLLNQKTFTNVKSECSYDYQHIKQF